jgi:hypothetical protein
MSQMSQNVTDVTDVTAVTSDCHGNVTDVTAISPQVYANKGSRLKMSQSGCDTSYKKQTCIRNSAPEGARPAVELFHAGQK